MTQIQSLNELSDQLEQAFLDWTKDPSSLEHSSQYENVVKDYTAKLDNLKSALQSIQSNDEELR